MNISKLREFAASTGRGMGKASSRLLGLMQSVLRWLTWPAIVIASLVPAVAMLSLVSDAELSNVGMARELLWASLLPPFICATWLVLRGAGRLALGIVRSERLGSESIRLLGALVTLCVFRGLVVGLPGLVRGYLALALGVPYSLASRLAGEPHVELTLVGPNLAWATIKEYFQAAGEALAATFSRIAADVALTTVLQACLFWAGLCLLTKVAWASEEPRRAMQAVVLGAVRWVRKNSARVWSASCFAVVLFSGVFLAMAAVTSLPKLREVSRPNSDVSPEALKRSLLALQITQEQVASFYPGDVTSDPFAEIAPDVTQKVVSAAPLGVPGSTPNESAAAAPMSIDEALSKEAGKLNETARRLQEEIDADSSRRNPLASPGKAERDKMGQVREADERLTRIRGWLAGLRKIEIDSSQAHDGWKTQSASYQALKRMVTAEQGRGLDEATSLYALSNRERLGSREAVAQFVAIQKWYAEWVRGSVFKLQGQAQRLWNARVTIESWRGDVRHYRDAISRNVDAQVPYATTSVLLSSLSTDSVDIMGDVPEAEPLGNSLGRLAFLAAWLLNADSLPLALVVGMLGFGLLGSVISTFVKARLSAGGSSTDEPEFVIGDLPGAVLRGLSATIVIFLSVQGGLAVLSGAGGADPNPYVVLLACFVASVFSEQVWLRVSAYFNEKLNQQPPGVPEETPAPVRTPDDAGGVSLAK